MFSMFRKKEVPSLLKVISMLALLLSASSAQTVAVKLKQCGPSFNDHSPSQQADILAKLGTASNLNLCQCYAEIRMACSLVKSLRVPDMRGAGCGSSLLDDCDRYPYITQLMGQEMTAEQRTACEEKITYQSPMGRQ